MKNSVILVFIFGAMLFTACTDKLDEEVRPPDDLIPYDTMINVMIDFRLMDAALINEQRNGNAKVYDLKYYYYLSILNKYGITREQYKASFDYYENNLKVLDDMYAEAITRLTKMKSELEEH